MNFFIFIIIPSILELIYTVNSIIHNNFQIRYLIIFIFYLITAIKAERNGIDLFNKKKKIFFYLILLPVISIFLLISHFDKINISDLYYNTYYEKKSVSTIYLYNESSSETILSFNTEMTEKPKTIIDKIYNAIFGIDINLLKREQKINVKKNEVLVIKIRPGLYNFTLETQNVETGRKYYVDLNQTDTLIDSKKETFFCFGGKNFFQFYPQGEDIKKLKTGLYTEIISLPSDSLTSKKIEK